MLTSSTTTSLLCRRASAHADPSSTLTRSKYSRKSARKPRCVASSRQPVSQFINWMFPNCAPAVWKLVSNKLSSTAGTLSHDSKRLVSSCSTKASCGRRRSDGPPVLPVYAKSWRPSKVCFGAGCRWSARSPAAEGSQHEPDDRCPRLVLGTFGGGRSYVLRGPHQVLLNRRQGGQAARQVDVRER